jgi:hypothetical protein
MWIRIQADLKFIKVWEKKSIFVPPFLQAFKIVNFFEKCLTFLINCRRIVLFWPEDQNGTPFPDPLYLTECKSRSSGNASG